MENAMKAEYKNCPKCHIINAPTATRCECGYHFTEGEIVTDSDVNRQLRAAKRRRLLYTIPVVLFLILYFSLSIKFGFLQVLVYSVGFVIVALLLLYITSKIKSALDKKRLGD